MTIHPENREIPVINQNQRDDIKKPAKVETRIEIPVKVEKAVENGAQNQRKRFIQV